MKNKEKNAIKTIREKLNVRKLNPRRLYLVDDGAYHWIGDRADLTAADARALRAISAVGTRPDLADAETRNAADLADYDAICQRCSCIAASHGAAGIVRMDDLPQDWRDGYALGDITPLR